MGNAQEDCYLGIGGKDDETIIRVFELTSEQQANLKNWGAELKYRNEVFKIRANSLLENHAQSSPEDLLEMSYKYKALLDSIYANMRMLDKRLLDSFNDRQYNLYIQLCTTVNRSPIF